MGGALVARLPLPVLRLPGARAGPLTRRAGGPGPAGTGDPHADGGLALVLRRTAAAAAGAGPPDGDPPGGDLRALRCPDDDGPVLRHRDLRPDAPAVPDAVESLVLRGGGGDR